MVIIKPVLPVVSDWWQHEFNEAEHLACIHSVYGSHHLQYEVAEADQGKDHSKSQNTLKSEDQVPFHLVVSQPKNEFNLSLPLIPFKVLTLRTPSPVIIPGDGPPPKFY